MRLTINMGLLKAQGAHRYSRREPKPGGGWRYYYGESSAARSAKEGDELIIAGGKIKIHRVDGEGVTVEDEKGKRTVSHDAWAEILAENYGDRYYEWAEKRARQYAGAVLKHVPAALFNDLKGNTDSERMSDLAKRLPDVHAKLQKAFGRAGISGDDARRAISWTLSRKGWTGGARSTLLGSMLNRENAWIAKNYRRVGKAAENLAKADGVASVDTKHVAAALALPRTLSAMDGVVQKATAEMQHIDAALKSAVVSGKVDDLSVSEKALAMIGQLQIMSQANPGQIDSKVMDQLSALLGGLQAAAPRKEPTRKGAQTTVYVAGEFGRPEPMPAEWVLVEAGDAIASHDPMTFSKNPEHNVGNERAYHRDKAEQSKVIANADSLRPDLVINTNPDATNGAPIVDENGVVLGGNSRAMSMQRVYRMGGEGAAALKDYLKEQSRSFGFKPEDVDALKSPMLVRRVAPRDSEHKNKLVRQLNENFTQAMDPRTMAVAQARRLDDKSLRALADSMGPDRTLSAFLSHKDSDGFVSSLRSAGVINDQNQNAYISQKSGRLNENGRALVENVLVGKVVGDADLLSDLPQSLVGALARSVPYIIQAENAGADFGLRKELAHALDAYTEMRHTTGIPKDKKGQEEALDSFKRLQGMREVNGKLEMSSHPALRDAKSTAILNTLIRRGGPRQMAAVFRKYADAAQSQEAGGGMGFSFFEKKPPEQIFSEAFGAAEDEDAKADARADAQKKAKEERADKEVDMFSKSKRSRRTMHLDIGLLKASNGQPLPLTEDKLQSLDGIYTPLGESMISEVARLASSIFGNAPVRLEDAYKQPAIAPLLFKMSNAIEGAEDVLRDADLRGEYL